jgi:hypothetical protein
MCAARIGTFRGLPPTSATESRRVGVDAVEHHGRAVLDPARALRTLLRGPAAPPRRWSTGRGRRSCRSTAVARSPHRHRRRQRFCRSRILRCRPPSRVCHPPPAARPPRKGARLPKLTQLVLDPATVWHRHTVALWYGRTHRLVEIASDTAIWYHSGKPPVPIRWLLVRDPAVKLEPQGFRTTDLDVAPSNMLRWFVARWRARSPLPGSPTGLISASRPAPIVRSHQSAHHPGAAPPVLPRHPVGARPLYRPALPAQNRRLVRQTGPYLQRCMLSPLYVAKSGRIIFFARPGVAASKPYRCRQRQDDTSAPDQLQFMCDSGGNVFANQKRTKVKPRVPWLHAWGRQMPVLVTQRERARFRARIPITKPLPIHRRGCETTSPCRTSNRGIVASIEHNAHSK